MAYQENIIDIKRWVEHEIHCKGKYGKKGEKRKAKKEPSKEQIARQNQRNRQKRLRWVIRANFDEGDLFLTIKYRKGERPDVERFNKDFRNFRNKLKRIYKKAGVPMKYVYRMEIGKNGGAHIHLILNRAQGVSLADIQAKWEHGRINAQTLYEEGGYRELAEYMTKMPEWTQAQQYSMFLEHGNRMWSFNTSRNLIRPKPKTRQFRRRTIERMVRDGIRPRDGYRVMPESIEYGVNPFTGMTYLHYTEERIIGSAKGERQKVPIPDENEEREGGFS